MVVFYFGAISGVLTTDWWCCRVAVCVFFAVAAYWHCVCVVCCLCLSAGLLFVGVAVIAARWFRVLLDCCDVYVWYDCFGSFCFMLNCDWFV